jgi:hypothetical protein
MDNKIYAYLINKFDEIHMIIIIQNMGLRKLNILELMVKCV